MALRCSRPSHSRPVPVATALPVPVVAGVGGTATAKKWSAGRQLSGSNAGLQQLRPIIQGCCTAGVHSSRQVVCSAAAGAATASFSDDEGSLPATRTKVDKAQIIKVASLGMLFFTSTFNYTILQNLRDFLIVTKVGAEALPFLEAYGVLPVSLAFFVLYNKLNQKLPEKWVYQAALVPFLAFYALFGAVLYPLAETLHPTHLLDGLRAALPAGFVGLAAVLVHWSYSLFFIMGELWGGVAISLLFWGLADEVCTMREAESVYPLLGIIANVGLVLSGAWIKAVNRSASTLATWGLDPVQALLGTILVVSVGLMAIKGFVQDKYVAAAHELMAEGRAKSVKEKKEKQEKKKPNKTLAESLTIFKRNPKVGNLAVLVIAYFISQKLFDISWKAQLKVMYPTAEACQTALAEVAQWTGVVTICLMATSKWVFRHGGWSVAALATPLLILISGGAFFASTIAMQGGATALGPQAVACLLAVGGVAGLVGRVASKAPKYSLFDPAKEMVYITMSKEEKNEGKAAVDLLGSYFGKSGASWIMQILVLAMGSLNAAMPIIALTHLTVCVAWTRATFSLGSLMQQVRSEEPGHMAASSATQASLPPRPPSNNGSNNGGSNGGSNGSIGSNGNGSGNGAHLAAGGSSAVDSGNGAHAAHQAPQHSVHASAGSSGHVSMGHGVHAPQSASPNGGSIQNQDGNVPEFVPVTTGSGAYVTYRF